jgi:hypothetical protein
MIDGTRHVFVFMVHDGGAFSEPTYCCPKPHRGAPEAYLRFVGLNKDAICKVLRK